MLFYSVEKHQMLFVNTYNKLNESHSFEETSAGFPVWEAKDKSKKMG